MCCGIWTVKNNTASWKLWYQLFFFQPLCDSATLYCYGSTVSNIKKHRMNANCPLPWTIMRHLLSQMLNSHSWCDITMPVFACKRVIVDQYQYQLNIKTNFCLTHKYIKSIQGKFWSVCTYSKLNNIPNGRLLLRN